MSNQKKRRKARKALFIAVYALAVAGFMFSVYKIKVSSDDLNAAETLYGSMGSRLNDFTEQQISLSGTETNSETKTTTNDVVPKEILYVADLCKENENIRGWIKIDGTVVDYPVLQGKNNLEYVNRLADGTVNIFGSIFLDSRNSADLSDRHNIIYGHNTTKGSMFGSLKEYKDESYFRLHPTFVIYTPKSKIECQIFAVSKTDAYGDSYDTDINDDEGIVAYAEKVKNESFYETNVNVNPGDSIITLSTCEEMFRARERLTIHAKVATNRESRED